MATMYKHRPVAGTLRILTTTCGVLAFLSAYAIAFAHENARTLHAADQINPTIAHGR
jgi:hypothetical protein